ncbi:hypothetical protein EUX98_g5093 [Antrodiella citrinella]|uniref:Uncharacterized protein n=1 Tax=Antrodiella citrinella TaxID=2447956 RepID=A0A4S4MSE5_9APHY|nr:hypothetical protein EUX98_g5093 [Antrodiella citrinella]
MYTVPHVYLHITALTHRRRRRGLMAAIVLERLRHDATVYERVPAVLLKDRGAGMGLFKETI